MAMDARRRLWAAAALGFAGLVLSYAYLQHRIHSTDHEILDEPPPPDAPTPKFPVESQSYPLSVAPVAQSPQPKAQGYTNEELQSFLEEDKKRLGIKKIYTKDELRSQGRRPPELDPQRARQVAEARNKIRWMAEELRKANEARKRPPVAINGDKPALLSKPEDSYLAEGSPTAPQAAPPPAAPSWTSPRLGPTTDEERVLRNQAELDRLWEDMKSSRPKPRINFEKQMVVAVIADRDSGKGVIIPRIQRSSGKITVEYRDAFPDEDGTYYEIQVIDRTDAPIVFRKMTALTTESPNR